MSHPSRLRPFPSATTWHLRPCRPPAPRQCRQWSRSRRRHRPFWQPVCWSRLPISNQANQSIIFTFQSLPISISNWITIWLPEYPNQSVEVFRICIHYADRIHFMVHLENQIKRVISTGTGKQEKISNRFRINLSRKYLKILINLRKVWRYGNK